MGLHVTRLVTNPTYCNVSILPVVTQGSSHIFLVLAYDFFIAMQAHGVNMCDT